MKMGKFIINISMNMINTQLLRIKNLFLKIKNIIVGNWRNLTGYTTDETKRRRSICKTCEYKTKIFGSQVCSQCGCIIKSKTAVESEKCLMSKW